MTASGHDASVARPDVALTTAAWYGDSEISLPMPPDWDVEVHNPATPRPLTDADIREGVRRPVGQLPIRELAAGAKRPAILVDDLTRPTPASRVLPYVLEELEAAGIPNESVTVVMATGTHGPPSPGAMEKKLGRIAASRCSLRVHDHLGPLARMGRTSAGTPVLLNRDVARADYVLGIGGVYPQHTTWFGGGSKLVLGVLGERSIAHLHYRHWSFGGNYVTDNEFRRDLDEVAAIAGLRTSISLHVDARRRAVRITVGDPRTYYADAACFSREAFRVPLPDGADVVISNAYPMDTSLTFACTKGVTPLKHAPPGASRVLVSACSEGDGGHGLFPVVEVPRLHYRVQWLRRQVVARSQLVDKARYRLSRGARATGSATSGAAAPDRPAEPAGPLHLYRPLPGGPAVHPSAAGLTFGATWEEIVARVVEEQGGRKGLRAAVYTCAPVQTLDLPEDSTGVEPPVAAAGGSR